MDPPFADYKNYEAERDAEFDKMMTEKLTCKNCWRFTKFLWSIRWDLFEHWFMERKDKKI